ncbi:N-acetylglucosamine-6-phosphate deacetylase [Glutamicibacter uratoxydans]|uniref:N-acetylglucosamine-6-phosphate deacetylase n=1 Tax=Glutamicibacter uratoxydans TaxID=43667 RepID=UPI003D6E74D2
MSNSQRSVLFARLVSDGLQVSDGALAIEGDRITFAGNRDDFNAWDEASNYTEYPVPEDSLLIPGLIDIHCHGAAGGDFSSPDHDGVTRAVEFLHRSGTTTVIASLVSSDPTQMLQACEILAEFAEAGLLAGIHAEGPFLSPERCGAQYPGYLTDPDPQFVDELVMAARGQLRTMTFAPELEETDELIEALVSHGIVPAVGHTAATSAQTRQALEQAREELESAGVDGFTERPIVTHLFNAMPPLHHRDPGPVAAALELAANDNAILELIADGVHLADDTVRMVFALVGAKNIALVSDSMAATGLADGQYILGPAAVQVSNGQAMLNNGTTLAGSTATLLQVLRQTVASGVPLVRAVVSATKVPAELIGLADEAGRLHQGFVADLLVLDPELELRQVWRNGQPVD